MPPSRPSALTLALGWQAGLVLGFIHMLTDTRVPVAWWIRVFKKCGQAPEAALISMWLDQTVHILCLAGWVALAGRQQFASKRHIVLVLLLVLVLSPPFSRRRREENEDDPRSKSK